MELVTTTLKSRNNVLRRRLKQCDNVGNEFVLALDAGMFIDSFTAEINTFFNKCTFLCAENIIFFLEILE